MDKIPIPEDDIVTLETVAPRIVGLRILLVNLYAVSDESGQWMLIDTGLPHSQGRIRRWAEEHFGTGARPSAILLTHGHFDHAGSVEALAREWEVPVYIHPLEEQYVTGEVAYPPPDPTVGGGAMSLMSKLYPRGPVNVRDHARYLPQDGSVPGLPEWRWIHTPGHTAGHISLFREADRAMVVGDAFVTTKQESFIAVATQRPELHGPPAYYTTDWDASRESVKRLASLRPHAVATGHGQPLSGPDVADALNRLANDFDRVARPERGRYVDEPVPSQAD